MAKTFKKLSVYLAVATVIALTVAEKAHACNAFFGDCGPF